MDTKMTEFEKFVESCNKKRCLRQTMYNEKTCATNYKQESCYKKYVQKCVKEKVKQEEKNQIRQDEINEYKRKQQAGEPIEYKDADPQWTELLKKVWVRDRAQCRFLSICTDEERKIIEPHLWGDFKKLDGAHCIPRSQSLKLKYELRNVYLLSRRVHSCLDNCLNPFTGENISKDERDKLWVRIIGKEEWEWLQKMVKEKY